MFGKKYQEPQRSDAEPSMGFGVQGQSQMIGQSQGLGFDISSVPGTKASDAQGRYYEAFIAPILRENRAWIIVFVLAAVSVVQGLALFQLIPLKESVPYIVEVEKTTGRVQVADNVLKKWQVTEGNVNYHLSDWIKWVDTLDPFVEQNLARAALFTRGAAVEEFKTYVARQNYPAQLIREPALSRVVEVKSISYINEGKVALVRYDHVGRRNGVEFERTPKLLTATVALITPEPASEDERINPIGLTIAAFQITNESLR